MWSWDPESGMFRFRSWIMPHRKKVSAQAKSKWQSGQPTFTHVEEEFSEDGSVYIDSGEEEIWWGEDESNRENTDSSLESIASLQRLYAMLLPPHLKQQNPVSICLCPYFSMYLQVNPQAKKAKISNWSVVYWKDSCTSDWQKRKYWKGALKVGSWPTWLCKHQRRALVA